MSAVAGNAGEQTLISISTDAVKRPKSVITITESMAPSNEHLQTHSIIRQGETQPCRGSVAELINQQWPGIQLEVLQ